MCLVEFLKDAIRTEKFLCLVGGFCKAVCINEERASPFQLEAIFLIGNSLHDAYRKSVRIFEEFKLTVCFFNHRILMSCVCSHDFTGGECQDPKPYRHKHAGLIVLDDHLICLLKDCLWGSPHDRKIVDHNLGDHHKQGSRNAFIRNIGNDQPQVIMVDQEKVVEIAADCLCRGHGAVNGKAFILRKVARDRILLNLRSQS